MTHIADLFNICCVSLARSDICGGDRCYTVPSEATVTWEGAIISCRGGQYCKDTLAPVYFTTLVLSELGPAWSLACITSEEQDEAASLAAGGSDITFWMGYSDNPELSIKNIFLCESTLQTVCAAIRAVM